MGKRQPKAEPSSEGTDGTTPLQIGLTLLVVLQGVGAFFPGPILWGISHLAYTPLPVKILWPLMTLGLIWLPAGARWGRWLAAAAAPRILGSRWVAYGVLPVVGGVGFWLLRCRTHFLGDGWLLGELVAKGVPYHGFDFTAYMLTARLYRLLHQPDEPAAFHLFALISIAVGVLYLLVAAWSARRLTDDGGERILLYGLLVLFTPLQMFMGYVECYALLLLCLLLFVAALTMHYRGRAPIWLPALAFGCGLAFHFDALFLAPLLAGLVLWPARRSPGSLLRRLAAVGLPALLPFGLVVLIYLLEGYNRVQFETEFVALRQGQRLFVHLHGEHGLLGWRHWKDILNLLLLLVPIPLVLVLAGRPWRRRGRTRPREIVVLGAACLWLLLLIAVLHMKLGTARDWDLFAATMPAFVFLGALSWSHERRHPAAGRAIGPLLAAALCLALPWFWLNAGEERSVQRFRDIIADQSRFSRAYAHEEIGKYYRKTGRYDQALTEYRRTTAIFPENARFHVVQGLLEYTTVGHDAALPTFLRALEADSTYAQALKMVMEIHRERQEYAPILTYARRLAGRPEEDARSAEVHGVAAYYMGLHDEALEAYERAVRKAPQRTDLIERLGVLYLLGQRFSLAERAFGTVLQRGEASVTARRGLAVAIWEPLSRRAEPVTDPAGRRRLSQALAIIETLDAEKQADPQLLEMGRNIQAALDRK